MKKLGQLLLERGWVQRSDLHRALNNQRMMGGRLGTCLLEANAVSEDRLVRALGEQLGVEPASADELRKVPEELLELLPRKLAVRCLAIPLHATSSKLEVAMLDTRELACQDEISFVTSRRLVVKVACEVRLREALDRHYGEPLDGRLSRLLDQLNRRRYLWREGDDEDAVEDEAPDLFPSAPRLSPPSLPRLSYRQAGEDATAAEAAAEGKAKQAPPETPAEEAAAEETASEEVAAEETAGEEVASEEAAAAPEAGPRSAGRPGIPSGSLSLTWKERSELYGGAVGGPLSFDDAIQLLGELTDRDEVGQVLVSFLRQQLDRVLLFGVRRNTVLGWSGDGEGLEERRIPGFRLSLDKPSIFYNLRQGGAFHLGPLPNMSAHRGLVDLLGGETPEECLLLPLRLAGHLVAVIYGDRNGEHLGGLDLRALQRLGEAAVDALERCILLKRQAQPGSSAG